MKTEYFQTAMKAVQDMDSQLRAQNNQNILLRAQVANLVRALTWSTALLEAMKQHANPATLDSYNYGLDQNRAALAETAS